MNHTRSSKKNWYTLRQLAIEIRKQTDDIRTFIATAHRCGYRFDHDTRTGYTVQFGKKTHAAATMWKNARTA